MYQSKNAPGSTSFEITLSLLDLVIDFKSWVLINSAAQEEVPDRFLGRVTGLISLVHRGAHATGLLFVSPLFAFVAAPDVFAAAAIAIPLTGLSGLVVSARAAEARAPATSRTRRS